MDIITRQQLSTWLWLNEMVLVSVGRPALGAACPDLGQPAIPASPTACVQCCPLV